jgi:hypothetical protein
MAERFKITPTKLDEFLRHYRECLGNFSEAARRISAHGDAKRNKGKTPAGYAALKAHAKRDPIFAGQITEVDAQVLDDVEAEIMLRAKGWSEPVFSAGRHAKLHDGSPAYVQRYDSKLLLAVARKLAPESWSEKHVHEHHHYIESQRWTIALDEINRLPPAMMANLSEIIDHLEGDRKERDGHAVKALPVIDVEYTEVLEWDDSGKSRQVKPRTMEIKE